jgi:acyl-coenzyme A thioesterase PaaI-like protein
MTSAWDDLELAAMPDQPGRFTTTISDAWMLVAVVQGGIVAAIAAQAMQRALDDPAQTLRSLTAVFAAQVNAGPVEIDTTVLRRGRSMSQLTATVRNPGSPAGLTAIAVLGTRRRGFDFTDLVCPDVPGPDGVRSFRDPIPDDVDFEFRRPPMPFWTQIVEARPALGRPPWEPHVPSPAEEAYWFRLDDPPISPVGNLDDAAAIVLCDTMPGAVFRKLGPDTEQWFGPSADFTIHRLGVAQPGWLLAHNRAHHAGDGYASVEMALWDPASRSLVAFATQMMFFAFGI